MHIATGWLLIALWAQQDGGGPKGGGEKKEPPPPFGLPSVKTLTEELKLSKEQAARITKLYQEARPKKKEGEGGHPQEGQQPGGGEKNGQGQKLRQELIARIKAHLTKEQQALLDKLLESQKKERPKNGEGPK